MQFATVPGHPLKVLRRYSRDPLGFTQDCRALGDLVYADLSRIKLYFLFHPDLVEHVLIGNARNYTKDTRGYQNMRRYVGNGLVTSQGEVWKRQRRIANPAFHRKSIEKMGDAMVSCSQDIAAAWAAADGAVRDVQHDMMEATLRIACQAFFSLDVHGGQVDRIGHASANVLAPFVFHLSLPFPRPDLLPLPINFRYWKGRKVLTAEVEQLVRDRRASSERPHDLLSMFLEAVDEETGEGMSDEQLRDELITMLVAGHETTANGLGWTLHLLAHNPDVLAKVHAELDEVIGDDVPGPQHLGDLTWLGQVFFEGLRLYPPAWTLARLAQEDDEIAGHVVPAGAMVMVPIFANHRDPRFFPDPERFDPSRFDADAPERPRYAWMPFSAGSRKCIGDRFARMEALIVLATVLKNHTLAPTDQAPTPMPALTLRARDGIPLQIRSR